MGSLFRVMGFPVTYDLKGSNLHRLPSPPTGYCSLFGASPGKRNSTITFPLPMCVFFLVGGAQLSRGFLALGSVLSVALLGGWSLFVTSVGLLCLLVGFLSLGEFLFGPVGFWLAYAFGVSSWL